jgi:hypothetical protein
MKYILLALTGLVLSLPLHVHADITSDIQVKTNGDFVGKNLVVMQRNDGNFFMRATWGQMFVRVTVVSTPETVFTRAYGEAATVADFKVGDLVDVDGKLSSGEGVLTVTPKSIRNVSLVRAEKQFSGVVTSVLLGDKRIELSRTKDTPITLQLTATTTVTKGVRTIALSDVVKGDKIVNALGEYDYSTKVLKASSIEVYQDQKVFAPRNFQGTLQSLSASTLPTVATVLIDGTTYTVHLSAKTSVLNTAKKPANLVRFVVGDTVRLFGAIRKDSLTTIDAEVIRDLAF